MSVMVLLTVLGALRSPTNVAATLSLHPRVSASEVHIGENEETPLGGDLGGNEWGGVGMATTEGRMFPVTSKGGLGLERY